jgi:hypothetical protein
MLEFKCAVAMHDVLEMNRVVRSAADVQFLWRGVRTARSTYTRTLTMTLLWGKTIVCSLVVKSASFVALLAKILSSVGRSGEWYYTGPP